MTNKQFFTQWLKTHHLYHLWWYNVCHTNVDYQIVKKIFTVIDNRCIFKEIFPLSFKADETKEGECFWLAVSRQWKLDILNYENK